MVKDTPGGAQMQNMITRVTTMYTEMSKKINCGYAHTFMFLKPHQTLYIMYNVHKT